MATEVSTKQLRPTGYMSAGCKQCVFFEHCGGLYNDRPFMDCFDQFCCGDGSCDNVCPYKPNDFRGRLSEIGGFGARDIPLLSQTSLNLPLYVPMIHHSYRRSGELNSPFVALDPYQIFRMRDGHYRSLADDGDALRRSFKVKPTSQIILRGTSEDRFLEQYWSYRKIDQVARRVASLGVSLFIGPNYSQFLDVPRPDGIFNRKRQLVCLSELSEAGIPVAPHLSTLMPPDWKFWTGFLKSQHRLHHVAINFQTGNKNWVEGCKIIDRFKRLEDELGRQLSLILVGGTQFLKYVVGRVENFTLIDSEPFTKAHRRKQFQTVGGKRRWKTYWTLERQPIDHFLQHNVDGYASWVEAQRTKLKSV